MVEAITAARERDIPVIFVNDARGRWDGDAPEFIRSACTSSHGRALLRRIAPRHGESLLFKLRYSAFDHTALVLLLRELQIERILLIGAATEGCVVQSGIDARELGFKVTVLAEACATNDPELEEIALHYAEQVAGMRIARPRSGSINEDH